jgi:uncharacterized phage protein (TIGR01671 family)
MKYLKVRAWDRQNNQMCCVEKLEFNEEGNLARIDISDKAVYSSKIEDFEIMLFAGLRDKNRKEIFEGDILRDELGNTGVVAFMNGEFTLLIGTEVLIKLTDEEIKKKSLCRDYEDYNKWYDCEIIGNKFENRELI